MGDLRAISISLWIFIVVDLELTYGLDIVADLFGNQFGNVLVEGVLDADFIAVWNESG